MPVDDFYAECIADYASRAAVLRQEQRARWRALTPEQRAGLRAVDAAIRSRRSSDDELEGGAKPQDR